MLQKLRYCAIFPTKITGKIFSVLTTSPFPATDQENLPLLGVAFSPYEADDFDRLRSGSQDQKTLICAEEETVFSLGIVAVVIGGSQWLSKIS